ncbi:LysR family transcriptional regulator [Acetobacterium woodii]|uniref:Transcriptional regulator n=1 Tax=Acetobacterium woodii (strain ATCC 29683 / DSM 1030 / JCM 2381 / KCTC 1655 / WB1) TaxID=931626 RepID=H6LDV2_ACEWD|nr:LysR family transcriptional regulator [Acetobacterium woodii]AFA47995.1 transcriptional regulator [Acetobacterium woodii DSM 1030]
MDSKKLKYFIEVSRLKSFSKAAQVLYVSQTAVSQQIAVLENELGFELLHRNKKTVELTVAGEYFLYEAKRIIALSENAVSKAQDIASGQDGMIKIGFFSMFDRDVIAPVLSTFHRKYPKIRLNIVQSSHKDLKANLLNHNLDIGFSFRMTSEELEEKEVYRVFTKLCVNKEHRLSGKSLIETADLEHEQIIDFVKNSEQMEIYGEHHSFEQPKPVYDDTFLVESMDDAIMLVYQNDGICFLPELTDFVNTDKITFIPQTIESVPFIVNAYSIKDNQNPVLKVFLEEIDNSYGRK